jgi:hypothetical protein
MGAGKFYHNGSEADMDEQTLILSQRRGGNGGHGVKK